MTIQTFFTKISDSPKTHFKLLIRNLCSLISFGLCSLLLII